ARKTGQALVAVFRRVYEYVRLVGGSHDGLFNLCIIRIGRAVSPFGRKARTAQKGLVGPISLEDGQRFAPQQSEAFISDYAAQQENVITAAGQLEGSRDRAGDDKDRLGVIFQKLGQGKGGTACVQDNGV